MSDLVFGDVFGVVRVTLGKKLALKSMQKATVPEGAVSVDASGKIALGNGRFQSGVYGQPHAFLLNLPGLGLRLKRSAFVGPVAFAGSLVAHLGYDGLSLYRVGADDPCRSRAPLRKGPPAPPTTGGRSRGGRRGGPAAAARPGRRALRRVRPRSPVGGADWSGQRGLVRGGGRPPHRRARSRPPRRPGLPRRDRSRRRPGAPALDRRSGRARDLGPRARRHRAAGGDRRSPSPGSRGAAVSSAGPRTAPRRPSTSRPSTPTPVPSPSPGST